MFGAVQAQDDITEKAIQEAEKALQASTDLNVWGQWATDLQRFYYGRGRLQKGHIQKQ